MKKRVIALLLCVVMLATTMGAGVFMPPDIKIIDADANEAVSAVAVPQSERVKLTTDYQSSNELGFQWQLSADGKAWVNVYGQTGSSILLSYAMVCNMLSEDGTAQVRCIVTDGDSEYESRAAEVSIDYSAPARIAKAPARAAAVQNDAAPADANDAELGNLVFVINYVFADGTQAANPWTATVPASDTTYTATVTSPTVVGYTPDQAVVEVNSSKTEYTVTYKPAEVNYTVNHYQQNIDNDNYTLVDTETKTGRTKSQVGDNLKKTYEGFTALLYDTTTEIAADGSTVIEIYYDRNYYLLSLDLDGGYGAEPMYARYGTPISIADPTKAGYTFAGWQPDMPTTMPAENRTLKAQWTANDTAKVTVVFWGENANDEEYSYYSDASVFLKPGTECTIDSLNGALICGKEEHTHTDACGIVCTHQHDYKCYGGTKEEEPIDGKTGSAVENIQQFTKLFGELKNGYIYRVKCDGATTTNSYDKYYLYFNDKWYLASADAVNGTYIARSDKVNAHAHSWNLDNKKDQFWVYNAKLTCTHKHDDSCYSCGKAAHTHSDACYFHLKNMDSKLWTLNTTKTGTVTVAADGTTIFNVYYDRTEFTLTFKDGNKTVATIKEKWGAEISGEFNKAPFNTTYNGRAWECTESSKYDYALQTLDRMPQFDATFNLYNKSSNTKKTIYYYVQKVGTTVNPNQWPNNTNNFDLLKQVDTYFNYATYNEEYHEIQGFTRYSASVAGFNDNAIDFSNNKLNLYYMRNSYTLRFYNHDAYVDGEGGSVQYEAPLSDYNFTPYYPDNLEKDAYVFDGWYTTAGYYDGSEANLETMTMPASDVILYAKWTPKTHTVKTYLTKNAMDSGNDPLDTWSNVPHRTAIENPPKTPENGNYTFVGWFYMDNGVEKAFDFSMPVTKDLNLYAKWSSNSLVEYTIKYTLKDGTEIAPPTTGSALAGATKTFDAKTGTALNEGYQSGYFPMTNSHSLTMDIDGGNEFTFVYVKKAEVNYTVKYLEKGTNAVLHEEKHATTSDAVITEKFETITGYAPDAYQKKLVLSADDDKNVLIFWYTKDEVHAPVQIIHWTQNIAGDGYTEYRSSTNLNGVIDEKYTETPLNFPGFKYNEGKSNASGTLTDKGLVLNLYYDRIEYPYEFRFLEQGTDKKLAEPEIGSARYQAQVTEKAKTIPGYELVSTENQAITIAIEDPADKASKNVKTFYYKEKTVDINYQIVGPDGCGTLTNYTETVKAVTGTAQGSTANESSNVYKFVGWYSDAECNDLVSKDKHFTPTRPGDLWTGATYYAKFEYNLTSMILKKEATPYDANDMFIFTVTDSKGKVFAKVALTAGEEVKLDGLTVGETYTVSEDTNWSWRYANQELQGITINSDAKENVVTVKNTVTNDKWLGASSYAINKCLDTISSQISAFFAQLFN